MNCNAIEYTAVMGCSYTCTDTCDETLVTLWTLSPFEELDGGLTVIQQRYNNNHNYHNDNSNNHNDNNNNHKIITMIIMIIIMSHECTSAMYSPRHAGGLFHLRGIDS
jgi:hypothetical protein